MTGIVFLFRHSDLYNIGCTDNLDRSRNLLRPTEVVAALKTSNSKELLRNLQDNYSDVRLPGSDYFRLTKTQANECERKLEGIEGSISFRPFFSGYKLVLAFVLAWTGISILIIKSIVDPIFIRLS